MNVFIEQLYLPLEEEWARFIPPLQRACLRQMVIGDAFQVGRFLIWGVRIRQDSSEEIDLKCGVLVSKLIDSLYPNGNRTLLLSIASISFAAPKISSSLGPLLLQHVLNFASEHGWPGVHIGCPQNGQYGEFVRQLTDSVGSWTRRPGKVVVRLSDIQRVGPLLTRLEKAVERKKGSAQWKIEPYHFNALNHWRDRINVFKRK